MTRLAKARRDQRPGQTHSRVMVAEQVAAPQGYESVDLYFLTGRGRRAA
ncbi:hypothetical protein [Paractinoplanes toevensis]|nr:hypothetical protein [Actinoplanes toevensis]